MSEYGMTNVRFRISGSSCQKQHNNQSTFFVFRIIRIFEFPGYKTKNGCQQNFKESGFPAYVRAESSNDPKEE